MVVLQLFVSPLFNRHEHWLHFHEVHQALPHELPVPSHRTTFGYCAGYQMKSYSFVVQQHWLTWQDMMQTWKEPTSYKMKTRRWLAQALKSYPQPSVSKEETFAHIDLQTLFAKRYHIVTKSLQILIIKRQYNAVTKRPPNPSFQKRIQCRHKETAKP